MGNFSGCSKANPKLQTRAFCFIVGALALTVFAANTTPVLAQAGGASGGAGAGAGTGTGTSPQAPDSPQEAGGRPVEQAPVIADGSASPTPTPSPTPAPAIEIQGYVRSTFASTDGGKAAQPFILPGAPAKYRLGNEPENYGELLLNARLGKLSNGTKFNAVTMLSLGGRVNHVPFLSDIDNTANRNFAQAYVQASDIPGLPGARIWAGRLYYRRTDIHINDFFYWNPSGDGVGIENAKVGKIGVSYAFFDKEGFHANDIANRHDFQLSDIKTNENGSLRLGLSYIQSQGRNAHNGFSLTAQHTQDKVLGGANRIAFQYGQGPGAGYKGLAAQVGDTTQGSNSRSYRVLDVLDFESGKNWNGQAAAIYQHNSNTSDGVQSWTSFGARPVYVFSDHFKLALDVGHDMIRPTSGDTRTLTKFTIAPTLTKGRKFFDRPELRFFYTYAIWNKAAQNAAAASSALSQSGPYGSARNGSTYGVQYETWW